MKPCGTNLITRTISVKQLSKEEKGEFLTRLAEVNFDDAWDRQMRRMLKQDDSIRYGRKHC